MVITISGNPIDGFSHHGPFTDRDAAIKFAEESLNDSWWLAELHPPVEAEAPTTSEINFMDELKPVSPEHAKQMMDFVTRRPIPAGKSGAFKKEIKRINKERRKQGLKKIKTKEVRLKVPKGWDVSSFEGNPFKDAAE